MIWKSSGRKPSRLKPEPRGYFFNSFRHGPFFTLILLFQDTSLTRLERLSFRKAARIYFFCGFSSHSTFTITQWPLYFAMCM